jgi:2-amino-4-hydroxy-6-hydroxymethyldihydropteridine diphosphokinase
VRQVERALAALGRLGRVRASSLFRTEPLGERGQPWYVNAVAELRTVLGPLSLLARLKELERRAGRPAVHERLAPRVLDLDLLLYGDLVLEVPGLCLPHPGLAARRFVLAPLCQLAPGVRDPRSGRTVRDLLGSLDDPLRLLELRGFRAGSGHAASAPAGGARP